MVPEAEKANVAGPAPERSACAPQPGIQQLMATFEHWKQTWNLVESPYNGMTFDCGVTREMGEEPVAVCRYLGERDRINHVHFRNVVVREPYVDYTEVFLDDGQVDMFAVMQELVRQRYPRGLYRSTRGPSTSTASGGRFKTSIPVAEVRRRDIPSAIRARCCRQR